jgi:hypothetical protein
LFRSFLEKGSLEATVPLPGAGRDNRNIVTLYAIRISAICFHITKIGLENCL